MDRVIVFKFFVLVLLLVWGPPALGQDATPALAPAPSVLDMVWVFCNSSVGITILSGALVVFCTAVFKAKPAAQKVFDTYRPVFFAGVKMAETAIPDGHPNAAVRRFDEALKLIRQLEPALSKVPDRVLAPGINAAHAKIEEKTKGPSGP